MGNRQRLRELFHLIAHFFWARAKLWPKGLKRWKINHLSHPYQGNWKLKDASAAIKVKCLYQLRLIYRRMLLD